MNNSVYRPFETAPERAFSASLREPKLDDALVFLDTNTLLAPYRASNEALQVIKGTYQLLRKQKRLIVPGEVAREFARTRPLLLTRLHNSLRIQSDSVQLGKLEEVPILGEESHFREAARALEAARDEVKKYRAALKKLGEKVEGWRTTDPVLRVYEKLFDAETVRDTSLTRDALKNIAEARYKERIPPGFRDAGKADGGYGDLAIWLTILEQAEQQQADAVFVSSDQKDDWYHVDEKHRIFPRYELAQEFSERTNGKAFSVLTLASFLKSYGAADEIVQQVKQTEVGNYGVLEGEALSYDRAELFVKSRIAAAGGAGLHVVADRRGTPDIEFVCTDGKIGVEIVLTGVAGSKLYHLVRHVQEARRDGDYSEIAIVLMGVTGDRQLDRWADQLAEDSFLGPGVSAIVCGIDHSRFHVHLNQSRNPVFQRAFPR